MCLPARARPMSSQSDLVTFHVTCNNKQAAIEFDTHGTLGGLRRRVQEIFGLKGCRLIGLDTSEVPLSLLGLPSQPRLTAIPVHDNAKLAVARVLTAPAPPSAVPLAFGATAGAGASGGASAGSNANSSSGASSSAGAGAAGSGSAVGGGGGIDSSLGPCPSYAELVRRLVQLTNLALATDVDRQRSERAELQALAESLQSRLWAQQQQQQQQSKQQQGAVANSSIAAASVLSAANSAGAGSSGSLVEGLRLQLDSLQAQLATVSARAEALQRERDDAVALANSNSSSGNNAMNSGNITRNGNGSGATAAAAVPGPDSAEAAVAKAQLLSDMLAVKQETLAATAQQQQQQQQQQQHQPGGVAYASDELISSAVAASAAPLSGDAREDRVLTMLCDAAAAGRAQGWADAAAALAKAQGMTQAQAHALLSGSAPQEEGGAGNPEGAANAGAGEAEAAQGREAASLYGRMPAQ